MGAAATARDAPPQPRGASPGPSTSRCHERRPRPHPTTLAPWPTCSSSRGWAGPAPRRWSRSCRASARGARGRAVQAALPARGAGDPRAVHPRAVLRTGRRDDERRHPRTARSGRCTTTPWRPSGTRRPTSATRWSRSGCSTCGRRCPRRGSSASCATSSRSRRPGRRGRATPRIVGWRPDQDASQAVVRWNRTLRRIRRAVRQRPDHAVVVEYDRFFGDPAGASLGKVLAWLGLDRAPEIDAAFAAGARDVRREGGAQAAHPLARDARVPRRARRTRRVGPGDDASSRSTV